MDRRQFVQSAAALGLMSAFNSYASFGPKKVLVMGGTGFLGPILVQELLNRGCEVTLFNRGKTNPHLFPKLTKLRGDRELPDSAGLAALKENSTQWDWVVDTWKGSSRCVQDAAQLLKDRTPQYQYVSTVSVYDKWDKIGIREDEPLNPLPTVCEALQTDNRYALRKTYAEWALRALMPGRCVFFRSHGLRGYPTSASKHEPYWQVKVKRGGDLVLPSDVDHYQVTDMVSLARFMVHCGETQQMGPFNVCYPPTLFREFIQNIVTATHSKVRLHWIPQRFLLDNQVTLLRERPAGRYRFDVSKALQAGLINRSYDALLADQLKGYFDRNPADDFQFGQEGTTTLSDAKEQQIISMWRAHQGAQT